MQRRVTEIGPVDLAMTPTEAAGLVEADGLVADPALVFVSGNSDLGGARAAQDVLAAPELPGALMVATDRTAIGLMRALSAAGLVIPRDIAVMSFGNIEAGAFSTPALSSVNQRFDEVGALAGRLVLATIRPAFASTARLAMSTSSERSSDSAEPRAARHWNSPCSRAPRVPWPPISSATPKAGSAWRSASRT